MTDEIQKINTKIELDTYNGTIKLDFVELLSQLDDEAKKELLSSHEGTWWSLVSKEMAHDIVNSFSRENYCSEYTVLRHLILNSDAMPKIIREWAMSMTESTASAKEGEDYWRSAYYNLYHWITEKVSYQSRKNWGFPEPPGRKFNYREYSKEQMKKVEEQIIEWRKEFPDIKLPDNFED